MTRTDAEKAPAPGSIWMYEEEQLRWFYIAQDGFKAIRITVRKSTGKVIGVDLEGFIHNSCREIAIDEDIQAAYRKQIDETGRSVPQYSDPAI